MRMVVLWVSLIIWFIGLWLMQLWRMILETNYLVWITFILLCYHYITVSEPSRPLLVLPPSLPNPACPFLSHSPFHASNLSATCTCINVSLYLTVSSHFISVFLFDALAEM